MIYLTSDTHFFHDREFIYKPRGFKSCEEMNECYIEQLKQLTENDTLYILGDFCLGKDYEKIEEVINSMKCDKILIKGNHDTDKKIFYYFDNGIPILDALVITYKKRKFYMSHYPTEVASLESNPKTCMINLHGHIHTKNKFHEDKPYLYNVSVDANENRLVTLDDVLEKFHEKVEECKKFLV